MKSLFRPLLSSLCNLFSKFSSYLWGLVLTLLKKSFIKGKQFFLSASKSLYKWLLSQWNIWMPKILHKLFTWMIFLLSLIHKKVIPKIHKWIKLSMWRTTQLMNSAIYKYTVLRDHKGALFSFTLSILLSFHIFFLLILLLIIYFSLMTWSPLGSVKAMESDDEDEDLLKYFLNLDSSQFPKPVEYHDGPMRMHITHEDMMHEWSLKFPPGSINDYSNYDHSSRPVFFSTGRCSPNCQSAHILLIKRVEALDSWNYNIWLEINPITPPCHELASQQFDPSMPGTSGTTAAIDLESSESSSEGLPSATSLPHQPTGKDAVIIKSSSPKSFPLPSFPSESYGADDSSSSSSEGLPSASSLPHLPYHKRTGGK